MVTGGARAGVFVLAGAMVLAGAALAFDYRRVATRMREDTERWWSAGRVRRGFHHRTISARPIGAITAILGMLIIVGLIFR
jgi:hypothetical protein